MMDDLPEGASQSRAMLEILSTPQNEDEPMVPASEVPGLVADPAEVQSDAGFQAEQEADVEDPCDKYRPPAPAQEVEPTLKQIQQEKQLIWNTVIAEALKVTADALPIANALTLDAKGLDTRPKSYSPFYTPRANCDYRDPVVLLEEFEKWNEELLPALNRVRL